MHMHTYIQADRQTDRQTEETDRQTDRQIDIHTYIHAYIRTYVRTCVYVYIYIYMYIYVYMYRERDIYREREIYRERKRERERERLITCAHVNGHLAATAQHAPQRASGPSPPPTFGVWAREAKLPGQEAFSRASSRRL